MYLCLCESLSILLYLCRDVCVFIAVCLSVCLSLPLYAFCIFACLSVLCACLSVCQYIILSVYLYVLGCYWDFILLVWLLLASKMAAAIFTIRTIDSQMHKQSNYSVMSMIKYFRCLCDKTGTKCCRYGVIAKNGYF